MPTKGGIVEMKEQNNNQEKNYTRRQFIQQSALVSAGILLAAGSNSLLAESSDDGMIYRPLGRTGERVSVIGLGGWHIGQPSISEQESIQLIRQRSEEHTSELQSLAY